MDLTPYKEALGDKFEELQIYVSGLIASRDEARKRVSAAGKAAKVELEDLRRFKSLTQEKLGIETEDELEAIQGKPAAAEMERQYQAKLKRLDAELKDRDARLGELEGRYKEARSKAAINRAIAKHGWLDAEVAGLLLGARVKFDDDQPRYETEDGRLIPLEEGAALLAKTKPHLLKARGAGGSGAPSGGQGGNMKNPWSKEHYNLTAQGALLKDNPPLAAQLQAAAN